MTLSDAPLAVVSSKWVREAGRFWLRGRFYQPWFYFLFFSLVLYGPFCLPMSIDVGGIGFNSVWINSGTPLRSWKEVFFLKWINVLNLVPFYCTFEGETLHWFACSLITLHCPNLSITASRRNFRFPALHDFGVVRTRFYSWRFQAPFAPVLNKTRSTALHLWARAQKWSPSGQSAPVRSFQVAMFSCGESDRFIYGY